MSGVSNRGIVRCGPGHVYKGRTDRKWPFDGQWCLCRKRRWSWQRHKRLWGKRA